MKNSISTFGDLPDDALISTAVIAAFMGIGISTAQRHIYEDPDFPRPIRFSKRCTRFRVGEFRAWVAKKDAETVEQLAAEKPRKAKEPEASPKKSKKRTRATA
ncbi:MAG: hypothetical protein WB444_03595 [Gallionella sp.]